MFSVALPVFSPSPEAHAIGAKRKTQKNQKQTSVKKKKKKTSEKNSDTTRVLGQTHIKVQQRSK